MLFAICLVDIARNRPFAFMPTGPFVHGSLFFVVVVPLLLCAGALVAIRARGAWERAMPFIAIVGGTALMMMGHALMESKSLASFALYALPILGAAYSWRGSSVAIVTGLMAVSCLSVVLLKGHNAATPMVSSVMTWLWVVAPLVVTSAAMGLARSQHERVILELQDSADADVQTGAKRRRVLDTVLRERLHATPTGRSTVLLVVDVDNLKAVNDAHGHAAGDAVLSSLVDRIEEVGPDDVLISRLGGDEFMVLYRDFSLPAARVRVEDLLARVATTPVSCAGGQSVPFSLSVGMASYPEHAHTPEELYVAAATALKDAKQDSRGRVVEARC